MPVDRKTLVSEMKQIILSLDDTRAKRRALQALLDFLSSTSVYERRVYRARVITEICSAVKDRAKRKELSLKLRKLLGDP